MITSPCHISSPTDTTLRSGFVLPATQTETLRVDCEGTVWRAQRAASCLLTPQDGDEVLLAPLADGRAFILAVLARAEREAELAFPHGVRVTSPLPVRLASASALDFTAPDASLNAARLTVRAGEVAVSAADCSLLTRTLRSAGQRLEQTFDSFVARLGQAVRMVHGHDETQAASARLAVTGTATTHAGTIDQTAANLVRVDAPQVHIS